MPPMETGTISIWALQALLADVNGDGNLDLALTYPAGGASIYLGNGKGIFTESATLPNPLIGASGFLTIADLNGDGLPDAALKESCKILILLAHRHV